MFHVNSSLRIVSVCSFYCVNYAEQDFTMIEVYFIALVTIGILITFTLLGEGWPLMKSLPGEGDLKGEVAGGLYFCLGSNATSVRGICSHNIWYTLLVSVYTSWWVALYSILLSMEMKKKS